MTECPHKIVRKDNDVIEIIHEESSPLDLDAPSLPILEPIDEREIVHHCCPYRTLVH